MADIWGALVSGISYSYFLRLFFGMAMFCLRLKRKKHFAIRMLACLAAYMILAITILPLRTTGAAAGTLVYIGWFGLFFLWLYLCFDEPSARILFCCIAGYTAQQLAGSVNLLYDRMLDHYGWRGLSFYIHNPMLSWLAAQSVFIIVYLVIYLGIARRVKFWDLSLKRGHLIIISLVALFVNIIFQVIAVEQGILTDRFASAVVILGYNILSCLIVYYLLFSSLSARQMQEDITTLNRLLAQQQHQYQMSRETIDSINIKCHDLKHQIRSIGAGKSLDPETIREMENTIAIYDAAIKTGNEALDVILTEKSLICNQKHIRITCIADGAALSFMKDPDIYALFGNALDNAMEAVMQLAEEEKRVIGLKAQSERGYVLIHIYNYYDTPVEMTAGYPQTSKTDKANHGFGIRSMADIAEKYQGNLSIRTENDIFHLSILFQR